MKLSTFDFREQPVRVIEREGDPWFVAADVCRALDIANSSDAVSVLDNDEKGVANTDPLSPGGMQGVRIISESGLYALVFRSRKPEAREFRRWVTKEVLPAIRKTGRYDAAGEPSATDRASWDLDAVFDMARIAGERLIAGTMSAASAATLSTLIQEARKVYELKWRIAPAPPEALPGPDEEIEALLRLAAQRCGETAHFRLYELFAMAKQAGIGAPLTDGKLTPGTATTFGRRLQAWRGRALTDEAGREFSLQHRRTKTGALYVIRFAPAAPEPSEPLS
jgi:prophage antirepressor-like protein